jgi:hypothetical protein
MRSIVPTNAHMSAPGMIHFLTSEWKAEETTA